MFFAQKFIDWFLACRLGMYEYQCRDDVSLFTMPFIHESKVQSMFGSDTWIGKKFQPNQSASFFSVDYGHYELGLVFVGFYGVSIFLPLWFVARSIRRYRERTRRLLIEERKRRHRATPVPGKIGQNGKKKQKRH